MSNDGAPLVNLVVALACEARPIIARHRLRAFGEPAPFRIYRDAEQTLQLIVSGVGRSAAACAVGYLAARSEPHAAAWLDVGTAGHRDLPLDSVRLAHKIEHDPAQAALYPQLVFTPPCATATVRTVDHAVEDYPDGALYEMEASGFFRAATRFATAELVSVLKVVSDNAHHGPSELDARQLEQRIGAALDPLETLVSELAALAAGRRDHDERPALLDELAARHRLSVSRRHQLRALLERASALEDELGLAAALRDLRSPGELIATLQRKVGEA